MAVGKQIFMVAGSLPHWSRDFGIWRRQSLPSVIKCHMSHQHILDLRITL